MRRLALALLIMAGLTAQLSAAPLPESVEADASTRQVSITSSFTGTEILVFGTVENSVQPSAEAGTYDIVVVVEGLPAPAVVRKKSNVAGIWLNTRSLKFASMPSYYAIASTRPVDEFADAATLAANGIGFEQVVSIPSSPPGAKSPSPEEMASFKKAAIRLKERERLFIRSNFGVTFIGRSLFRATIALPPNVPVAPLDTRVFLFKEGKILGQYKSRVMLQREGIERTIHDWAIRRPKAYGIATVLLAAAAGLAAAFAFRRPIKA